MAIERMHYKIKCIIDLFIQSIAPRVITSEKDMINNTTVTAGEGATLYSRP